MATKTGLPASSDRGSVVPEAPVTGLDAWRARVGRVATHFHSQTAGAADESLSGVQGRVRPYMDVAIDFSVPPEWAVRRAQWNSAGSASRARD
jgi:hypothetical protein